MKSLTGIILDAYRTGVFPMAESADDDDFAFYRPYQRALIPIHDLHIPTKLLKALKRHDYTVSLDRAFADIIDGCAAAGPKRTNTWINTPIRDLFVTLHGEGHAHSIEVWDKENKLMGGLYGLSIGAVFCGESMVSFKTNGSKIALVYLCALLHEAGYTILDSQFMNPHLLQFGAYEIPQQEYEKRITVEMAKTGRSLNTIPIDAPLLGRYLSAQQTHSGS